MKKLMRFNGLLVSALMLSCSVAFTSCSNDDEEPTPPAEITTDEMFGNYDGKMMALSITPIEGEEGEEKPVGTDVSARIDKNTVYFDAFPIRDIVVSIVGEEAADKIVEAVGDVSYEIAYEPILNEEKDQISFKLDPKPLVLTIDIPSEGEEPIQLNIEVKVSVDKNGSYDVKSTDLKFNFSADEVAFVNGDEKTPIDDFKPTTFDFNMNKAKGE